MHACPSIFSIMVLLLREQQIHIKYRTFCKLQKLHSTNLEFTFFFAENVSTLFSSRVALRLMMSFDHHYMSHYRFFSFRNTYDSGFVHLVKIHSLTDAHSNSSPISSKFPTNRIQQVSPFTVIVPLQINQCSLFYLLNKLLKRITTDCSKVLRFNAILHVIRRGGALVHQRREKGVLCHHDKGLKCMTLHERTA